MRTVVVYELVSLDGVAEDPDRFFGDWGEELDANLDAVIAQQDAVILGRRSYDDWAPYWPTSDLEPFATFINGVTKYVATSRPLEPEWTNASVIEGDLVEFVRELKSTDGGEIGVHASISVARALLAGGVVDELRLVIFPAIAGSGRQLLADLPAVQLAATSIAGTGTGHLLVGYRIQHFSA